MRLAWFAYFLNSHQKYNTPISGMNSKIAVHTQHFLEGKQSTENEMRVSGQALGENGLAAHGGDFHDLGYDMFVLGDQPHHEQALARPILLRKPPGDFDLLDNVFSKFWQGSHAEGKIG